MLIEKSSGPKSLHILNTTDCKFLEKLPKRVFVPESISDWLSLKVVFLKEQNSPNTVFSTGQQFEYLYTRNLYLE